ncbi:MAG: TRAP transporter large permease [Holosporales bacterium]|jgi:tripartite ATP-independent transporter DctM subunit|nr:TRAP transporter large permease [Holosporales bacterium]
MNNGAVMASGIILLVLLFLRAPVFCAVFASGAIYWLANISNASLPQIIFAQRIVSGVESNALLAIPFFVCSGVLMNYTGVTDRIMHFCSIVTGRRAGGLGHVNVLLSTLMGGLSGSNMADAAMEAKMLVPAMEEQGYTRGFSSALTAVSSIITPLIPPGIAMIIYGSIAGVSIGKLFVAGIGPGLMMCVILLFIVSHIAKKNNYKPIRSGRMSFRDFYIAIKSSLLPLCLPVIIIGGIRLGIFTPTEAGAVAIFYAIFLGLLYRQLTLKNFLGAMKETVLITSSIMIIIGGASAIAWFLTKERIPQQITESIVSMISNKWIFLVSVDLFLILVGMFIEGNAAMIILVPLLVPIARSYGIDDIHFAIVFIFTMICGGITPPMGTLMFLTCGVAKCPVKEFIKECVPFYIMLGICIILLIFFPIISTGIVGLVY